MSRIRKIKKIKRKVLLPEYFIYGVVATLLIIFIWWLLAINHLGHIFQSGNLSLTAANHENDYKNLDLAIARQADYTSQAVKEDKSLGNTNNVRHYIFSFGVPHDNLTEKGLMTLPKTPAPKDGYPVIILLHGYASPIYYSTTRAYLADMEFYSQHGFAVLKPDLRGQGLSIPDGQPEGAYYSMAYNTDTLSLVAAVKKTGYLDKKRVNLWGHSMGAYVALRASVVSNDIKHTILLSGPVGYIQDMFTAYVAISDTYNSVAANIRLEQLDKHGTPMTNPSYWDTVSPLSYLKDNDTYFQIHVGTADAIVPPQLSKDLDEALSAAGKQHQYYVYPGGHHGLVPERSLIWQRSLELLNKT